MKKSIKVIIVLLSWVFILWLNSSCQRQPSSANIFTLAQDSCFKNTLVVNPDIKVWNATEKPIAYQYPVILKSKLDIKIITTDSMAFLSPREEVRTTNWSTSGYGELSNKPLDEPLTYKDLIKYNTYAVQQRMFLRDSTLKIVKNVMYKNCQHPHFVMQGENAKYIYFLKTELSPLALSAYPVFKNFLVRFPQKLKKKYWGTVHQMMEDFGYYIGDTTELEKRFDKLLEKHGDTLRKLVKERRKK